MMNTAINTLPLQNFFEALRKNSFNLGIEEYYALLDALHSGVRLDENKGHFDKENLKFLCETLWLKPNQSPYEFEALFEEHFEKIDLPTQKQSKNQEENELEQENKNAKSLKNQENKTPNPAEKDEAEDSENTAENPIHNPNENLNQSLENEEFRIKFELTNTSENENTSGVADNAQVARSFLFTNNYFKISQRQLQQATRFLPIFTPSLPSQEIDLKASINHWAKRGFFEKPIFKAQKAVYNNVVLLTDNKGSMQAFEPLGNMLSQALQEAFEGQKQPQKQSFEEYFFYNVPQGYFYQDKVHTKHQTAQDLFAQMRKRKVLVLIFSDAGAARGGNSDGRFKATLRFLIQVRKVAQHLVWLNPMPRKRWEGTTAQRIGRFVDMFSLHEKTDLPQAIHLLKGKTTWKEQR